MNYNMIQKTPAVVTPVFSHWITKKEDSEVKTDKQNKEVADES
jgi:hypothetical protein